jgi:peptidoglycan/xylan/chitin deacetylase (PgdA/CDA1 family)
MGGLRASIGFVSVAVFGATASLMAVACVSASAWAEGCPGNPDALGTSRVLVLEPEQFSRVGLMQYPQSLPLADKEVVLTFDDGPLPRYSNPVLDILAAHCVKATYFLIGEMAREFPATVRRIHAAGHTIGTHTESHPSRMHKLPIEKVRTEIDRGIADVGAALWDARGLAPFFRIPGLDRTDAIEQELAARSLVVFSSDTVADDWHRRIRPADIVRLALSRLEARGKGILLLHDIHAATVAALPALLKKLKDDGFHIVHVVPGTRDQIAIAAISPHGVASEAPRALADETPHQLASDPPRDAAGETPHGIVSDPPREAARDAPHGVTGDQPRDIAALDPQHEMLSDPPRQVAADLPPLDRNEPDWPASDGVPIADDVALPTPDPSAFATDYHPWRTVLLADGSASAIYLALGAVTQWSDPPTTPVAAGKPQLPAPAMPAYFGGGETVTSIAE